MVGSCVPVLRIAGFPDPEDVAATATCAFTGAPFASLPSGLPVGTVQRPWVLSILAEDASAELRQPSRTEGRYTISLADVGGALSRLLRYSPVAALYPLEQSRVTAVATSLRVSGDAPPLAGSLLWLEEEAVEVTAVSSVGPTTHDLTVVRGRCGSRAVAHALTPSRDWQHPRGLGDRLLLRSLPDLGAGRWLGTLDLFHVATTTTLLERVPVVLLDVTERPGGIYVLTLAPDVTLLADHQPLAGCEETRLSRCLEATRLAQIVRPSGNTWLALEAACWLTGQEASRLFDESLVALDGEAPDADAVSDLADRLAGTSTPLVRPHLHIQISGGEYLYAISSVALAVQGTGRSDYWDSGVPLVRVGLDLVGDDGTPVRTDSPQTLLLADQVGGGSYTRWGNGWVSGYGGLALAPGEEGALVEVRLLLVASPPEILSLLWSGETLGGVAGLWGQQSLGLSRGALSLGTAAPDPSTVTKASTSLLQLAQVMPAVSVPFTRETRAADVLDDLLRLYTAFLSRTSAGLLAIVVWARPVTTSTAVVRVADEEISPGASLVPLFGFDLTAGRHPLTWEHTQTRAAQIRGARRRGAETQSLRLYDGDLRGEALSEGLLGECLRLFALMFGGSPSVLPVKVSPFATERPGAQVTLTAGEVADYAGRGVTSKRCVVIGRDLDWSSGETTLLLLADEPNNPDLSSPGRLAPALRVESLRGYVVGASSVVLRLGVSSEGETGAALDLATAHPGAGSVGIWSVLASDTRAVRIVSTPDHAPGLDASLDRPGLRECYGTVQAVGTDWLEVEVSLDWERGGLTLADYVVAGQSWVVLADRRADTVSGLVSPAPEQFFFAGAGADFAVVTGPTALHVSTVS